MRVETFPVQSKFPTGQVSGGFLWLHGRLIKIPAPTNFCTRGELFAGCFYPDDREDIVDNYYFCLPLRTQKTNYGIFLCGLFLRQIKEPWGWVYQRVGFFRCRRGDSLQILGQKKHGLGAYEFPDDSTEGLNSEPFESIVTII